MTWYYHSNSLTQTLTRTDAVLYDSTARPVVGAVATFRKYAFSTRLSAKAPSHARGAGQTESFAPVSHLAADRIGALFLADVLLTRAVLIDSPG